jgi:hypothetical protein
LKANLIGKLKGLEEFTKALNYVALTYPNSEEGKQTEVFIATKIPYLESLNFNSELPVSWKVLYSADNLEDANTKKLLEKVTKFAKERTVEKLTVSTDIYTLEKNFIVIHGIKSKESAIGISQVLKEFKEYKVVETPYIISSENYKVVQIKKSFDEYVSGDWLNKPIVPVAKNIVLSEIKEENKTKLTSKEDVKNAMNNAQGEAKPKPDQQQAQPNNQIEQQIKQQQQQSKDGGKLNSMPPGMSAPTSTPKR